MKKVELSSLNIDKLYRIKEIEGGEAALYSRGFKLIKVYNPEIDREHRMMALESISGLKIKNVIVPNSIITDELDDRKAVGCTMRYYPNAKKLKDFFTEHDKESYYPTFFSLFGEASKTLRDIHKLDLVYGDVNISNILYLPDYRHLLCDFDGVSVFNRGPESALLYMYRDHIGMKRKILTEESDKISMYLYFLNSFFSKKLFWPDEYDYDEISESFPFLRDSKSVFMDVINTQDYYCSIPYLYEILPTNYKINQKNKKITCKQ